MTTLEPVSVALKFGFLAVLYLFLLWVARSARRDLGANGRLRAVSNIAQPAPEADATGMYSASTLGAVDTEGRFHGPLQEPRRHEELRGSR